VDFFERQEASRRATRYLVLLFGAAFLLVALATGLVFLIALGFATNGSAQLAVGPDISTILINSIDTLLLIVAAVAGLMVVASLFRAATLSQGGGHIARSLGGRQVSPDDGDPLHRRLLNVVEEMAIASGLPVPEVYVLEAERGINAFAAGLTPADAAVAVTRGSLEQLSRAELQGVVAHEFSHILNGDMRLNLRLMGFSFGILVLSLVGRWLLRASSRGMYISRRRGSSPALLIGLGLTIVGFIGVLLSRLIKAAVSRQRETLADASAVQFTREPLALAGALKKIGGFTPFIETVETEEVSHMLFGQAGKTFVGLFATHPPLPDRIRALDPSFKPGDYISPASPAPSLADDAGASSAAISRASAATATLDIGSAGTIERERGSLLRRALPEDIVDAAHSTQSSWLLVLALGLERGGGTTEERRLLENQLGPERAQRCFRLRGQLDTMEQGLLLPLFELTVPALKARPREQLDYLFELLGKLAAADGTITLFEFLLHRTLGAHFGLIKSKRVGASERARAATDLLATLAVCGAVDSAAQSAAFAAGLAALGASEPVTADSCLERARASTGFDDLDHALTALAAAALPERRRVLAALAVTMRHDARTDVAEAELFRAIAAVLGCPVPPMHVIG
jgi:Zn-dependent protease with chaperone function